MTDRLLALVAKARLAKSNPEDLAAHLVSFAYGNAACEDGRVTREGVERAAAAWLKEKQGA